MWNIESTPRESIEEILHGYRYSKNFLEKTQIAQKIPKVDGDITGTEKVSVQQKEQSSAWRKKPQNEKKIFAKSTQGLIAGISKIENLSTKSSS